MAGTLGTFATGECQIKAGDSAPGAGCRDGGGTGCVDLPLGLSLRPKRSALRAPHGEATAAAETEAKHQEPKQRAKTEETTRKEEPKRDTTKNQQLRWGQIRRSKGAKPG